MKQPADFKPSLYATAYGLMRTVARDLGYALALHGSLARDLDVIAIPWTDDAAPAAELVDACMAAIGGHYLPSNPAPEPLPHGRLVWTIMMDAGCFVDFGVMPRDSGRME